MNLKIFDFLILILYCCFIYWVSSRQSLPAPMWFEHQDKFYHAGAYCLMGILAWRCFQHYFKSPIILAFSSIAFCSIYGVADEWHQSFVPGRDSSHEDWLADTIGAMIGVYLITKYKAHSTEENEALTLANCAIDCANCTYHEQHTSKSSNPKS